MPSGPGTRPRSRALARDQAGLTIVELVAAVGIAAGALGAVVTAYTKLDAHAEERAVQGAAEDQARRALSSMGSDLRAADARARGPRGAVERAGGDEIVIRMAESGGRSARVRYCLQRPTGQIWRQVQGPSAAAKSALPAPAACPAPAVAGGFGMAEEVASGVANGAAVPVFALDGRDPSRATAVVARIQVGASPGRAVAAEVERSIPLAPR